MFDFLSRYMIGTPDFGHADIWHQNFSFRFLLSDALKSGYLPLWSKDIASGFPLFAEGQAGILNLSNLILFYFFNPILATNLTYILIFLATFLGTYLFSRVIHLNKTSALFCALLFTFSGMMITQTRAIHLIQSVSFLPWEFYLAEKIIGSDKKRWALLFAFALSQQIFAGYVQIAFISLVSLAIYLLAKYGKSIFRPKLIISLILGVVLGAVIALPQIIPTWELTKLSFRVGGIDVKEIVRFPINPKMLLTFFYPYLWGNPKFGTYPPFDSNWGIFWESIGYIGILPLLLLIPALFFKIKTARPFLILAGVSLILALGKYTPLLVILLIPPFSFFRVPARFLIPFVFSLCVIASIGFQKLIRHRILSRIIIVVATLDLLYFALGYIPLINGQEWLKPPQTVEILNQDTGWYRVYAIKPAVQWNNIFLAKGWADMHPFFDFRNALDPDQNLYWKIPSADYYAGINTRRSDYWLSIIDKEITFDQQNNIATISAVAQKVLDFTSIKYLITPYPIQTSTANFMLISETSSQPKFYIYKNSSARPHAYITNAFMSIDNLVDLGTEIHNEKSINIILEEPMAVSQDETVPINEAIVTKNTDLEVIITAVSSKKSILVLTDTYYPGWQATIDGSPTRIYPVNINQRAIIIPSGNHQIKFNYNPWRL